jgi:hypothetical protein
MTADRLLVEFPAAETLQRLALSNSGFVFDPMTGNSFTVSSTGLAILRLLQQNSSLEQILKTLHEEYDAEPGVAERDVIEFAGQLCSQLR